ncbi:MAG TPA: heme-binding protein [Polyangiaceae bacterium]|nr:heme-binding protein [Polyangiaceae bacterium]
MSNNRVLYNAFSEIGTYASPVAALSAVGLGIGGLLGAGPRTLRRHPLVAAALACAGTVALAKSQFDRFLTQKPPYELVDCVNGVEIRRYAPRVVAETIIGTTSFGEAREEGFRRLAGYIFGDNVVAEPGQNPLGNALADALERAPHSEQLAMTAPVTLTASERGYVMHFLMPKDREFATLPQPKDPRVVLRRLPLANFAVLRFRGSYAAERIEAKERELVERMEAAGLQPKGELTFAGYDPPSALPFLRRVEVWVGLA